MENLTIGEKHTRYLAERAETLRPFPARVEFAARFLENLASVLRSHGDGDEACVHDFRLAVTDVPDYQDSEVGQVFSLRIFGTLSGQNEVAVNLFAGVGRIA